MTINYPEWTQGLHHDGSGVFVSNLTPKLDEEVTITVRAPLDAPIRAMFLRSAPDGENQLDQMHIVDNDARCAYWSATLRCTMPMNHYRFKILTDEGAYFLNQRGLSRANGPDWGDFKIVANLAAPLWTHDSVFYQIFPDRFYDGDPSLTVKPGAWSKREHSVQVREWGAPPLTWAEAGNIDFYGGDLPGITQKLDYLQDLGVTAIYLTPIFTSSSNHRYNIHDFYNVDPHLGGNEALIELRRALDARGMRLILDITPNHIGSQHPWFLAAQADLASPTAEYFSFNGDPDNYVAWLGVRSLPKLNYQSQKLREVMYEAPDSVLRYWLKEPFRIDGWRLDVQNMTARQGATQLDHKIGRAMRRAIKAENPEAYLFGEHFFDGTPYLQGDELDATMNYQGFNIPMWRWLAGFDAGWQAGSLDTVPLASEALEEQLRLYRAAVPWAITLQQFNQLCSHDTVRILTICKGDKRLVKLGAAMLMAYPGVPCVYYADEIGMEGEQDPDNRRTMPWNEAEWDMDMRRWYQTVIRIRRDSPAFKEGGYQQVYAQGGLFAFQRLSAEQRIIVVGYRGPLDVAEVSLPVWHTGIFDGVTLVDRLNGGEYTVQNGALTLTGLTTGTAMYLEAQA